MSESESWGKEDTEAAVKFDKWLTEQEKQSKPITYYDDFGELVGAIDEASK